MTMERDRLALKRVLEDYNKLAENEFWHRFWKDIEKEKQNLSFRLARGESLPEQKLRYWQGAFAWLELMEDYPRRILEDTKREIDK